MPSFVTPVREYNPYHEPAGSPIGGRFARAPGTAGSPLGRVVSHALTPVEQQEVEFIRQANEATEKALKNGDTKARHTLPDGSYTPERLKVHEQVIRSYIRQLEDKHGPLQMGLETPTVTFLGGLPGAGKSTAVKGMSLAGRMISDPDAMKALLPEFKGSNAAELQRESGDIADKLVEIAYQARMPLVIDGTMKTSGQLTPVVGDGLLGKLAAFKDAGYRTEIRFVDVPVEVSAQRVVHRFLQESRETGRPGRWVPPEFIRTELTDPKYGTKPRRSLEMAKDVRTGDGRYLVDAWTMIDGVTRKQIAGRGVLT